MLGAEQGTGASGAACQQGRDMKRHRILAAICVAVLGAVIAAAPSRAADDTIKIGYVDPFSGPFAATGNNFLKVFNYLLGIVNAEGGPLGKKYELVTFDSKLQPAEALIALKSITDQNIPFVMHCVGSNVGSAMIDAVSKHNARNPDNRVIYLNCGALATELTNEQCDFWHFRFTANVDQRAVARIKTLPKSVTSVYVLNQDYLFGQSVEKATLKYLAQYRPDIKIVADELVPFGKVQDFSPYVAKIKASGAQSLVTSNYDRDLNLLLKAGNDAGLDIRYDAYLAHQPGGPTSIGAAGDNRLTSIMEFNDNVPAEENNEAAQKFVDGFRSRADFNFIPLDFLTMFRMLTTAINKAGSTDALKVALALEGMKMNDLMGDENIMRAEDHQLLSPLREAIFTRTAKLDAEHTGLGWKTQVKLTAADLTVPTTCKMKRPTQ
jgi:branched-chain amino acid transport system substrate-binding protein